jgi:exosortase/archaeosortase family protein
MSGPLQTLATICSTFSLQSLGLPALAEGNRILLDEKEVNIVEACSGLRMLVVFFALSAGMALVVQRRTWEKLLITLSAIPIALVANVIRITVTGVLLENVDSETANHFFHDLAGWFMMPLALGLLGLELTILSHLLVERTSAPLKVELDLPRTASPVMRPRRPWKRAGESKPGVAKPGVAAPSPAPVEEPAQA